MMEESNSGLGSIFDLEAWRLRGSTGEELQEHEVLNFRHFPKPSLERSLPLLSLNGSLGSEKPAEP